MILSQIPESDEEGAISSPFSSPFASGPKAASFSFWIGTPIFSPKLRPCSSACNCYCGNRTWQLFWLLHMMTALFNNVEHRAFSLLQFSELRLLTGSWYAVGSRVISGAFSTHSVPVFAFCSVPNLTESARHGTIGEGRVLEREVGVFSLEHQHVHLWSRRLINSPRIAASLELTSCFTSPTSSLSVFVSHSVTVRISNHHFYILRHHRSLLRVTTGSKRRPAWLKNPSHQIYNVNWISYIL